jgi:hypothetical protein
VQTDVMSSTRECSAWIQSIRARFWYWVRAPSPARDQDDVQVRCGINHGVRQHMGASAVPRRDRIGRLGEIDNPERSRPRVLKLLTGKAARAEHLAGAKHIQYLKPAVEQDSDDNSLLTH